MNENEKTKELDDLLANPGAILTVLFNACHLHYNPQRGQFIVTGSDQDELFASADRAAIIAYVDSLIAAANNLFFDDLFDDPGHLVTLGEYHQIYYDRRRGQFVVDGLGGKEIFASADRAAVQAFLDQLNEMTEEEYYGATG